ncbi:MAG: ATP-dependent DNA helicase RecG, partial [Oscillospiraceae bacterium]
VGSGKTAVAAAACYFSHKNGYQSALMAPTEILANQHFRTLSQFLEPLNVKICLLTGSLSPKNKAEVKQGIANGEFSVVVGTHALVQQSTEFQNLGLVITDEQHRFGVNQRATLAEKGGNPHKLVMSATPIPRTLGLIIYGDLEISVLNELPQGRLPIDTFAVGGKIRERAYNFIKKHLDEGRQAYIVCPMIEDGDAGLIAVNSYSAALSEGAFKGYSVGLLHGKMKSDEKNRVMAAFKDGEIQLLVSTTVVEVGVDVPNAIVMLVENADRFGLSQLHQLRGRVGRGEFKSYCILVTDNFSPEVKERLTTLTKISDGFKISEEDLRIRGCGDFFGERQHGLPPLKIAQFDAEMLSVTQTAAKELLAECPDLSAFPALKSAVERLFDGNGENGLN